MIKIGRNHKVKYSGIKKDVMADLAMIINKLRKDCSEEEINLCCKLGLEAFEECNRKKPKVETYEINAKNKNDAIKQVKALELPKHVEKVVLEQLIKE